MAVWTNIAIDYKVKCDKCPGVKCTVERENGDHHIVSMIGAMRIAEAHRSDIDGRADLPCIREVGPVNYRCTCPDCGYIKYWTKVHPEAHEDHHP